MFFPCPLPRSLKQPPSCYVFVFLFQGVLPNLLVFPIAPVQLH